MQQSLSASHVDLLAKVELFAGLDRLALARIASHLEPIAVEDQTEICRQGDLTDCLYLVARGNCAIFVSAPDGSAEVQVGTLAEGDCFGEMALLTAEPRAATVRAIGAAELLRLERAPFLDLFSREPAVARTVVGILSQRLRTRGRTIVERDQALVQATEHALEPLSPARRMRVLQASVLVDHEISRAALGAVFEKDADEVIEDLARLGIAGKHPSQRILALLRERLAHEAGAGGLELYAREAVGKLAQAGCWEAALAVAARYGQRPEFLGMLRGALRSSSTQDDQLLAWVDRITDDEALQDATLAAARARWHERRGDRVTALHLLNRALSSTLIKQDPSAARQLTAQVAALSATSATQLSERAAPAKLPRPRPLVLLGAIVAAAMVVVALTLPLQPRWSFSLLTAAAIILWITEPIPAFAIGLGLIACWIVAGITPPAQAAAGFASLNWLFVVAILGIAAAVARSGLLYRVGLLLVRRMPAHLVWQAATLTATGLMLSPLLPNAQARCALTAPLALAVVEASRLRDREPEAALLGLATWIGSGPLMFMFLNGGTVNLLVWSLLPEASRLRFTWFAWFVAALPLGLFVTLASLAALFLVLRPRQATAPQRQRLEVQLALLGQLSRPERAMIGVLALTVAGWIVAPMAGLDVRLVAIFGLLAAVASGSFDARAFQNLDWNYLTFLGVSISIPVISTSLGLDRIIGDVAGDWLALLGGNPLVVVLVIATLSLLVRLVLEVNQGMLLLCLVLFPLAPHLGVHPWVIAITMLANAMMWFIPVQTGSYLVSYTGTEGRLFTHAQARRVCFVYTAITLIGLALVIPYWRFLGLL